jgi:Cys-tRNA(Pro)/Cys-tRNA(Cys) deacylase
VDSESTGAERVEASLRDLGIDAGFVRTAPASSAEESASLQGIELSQLLKTIVVRVGEGRYVFVLVPGDRAIDWKKLRKHLGVSRASLPERSEAERITGYSVGTITPFGSLTTLPVILDAAAAGKQTLALGAGERGVNVHMGAVDLESKLGATVADVTGAQPRD